jgi:hypothetical protein
MSAKRMTRITGKPTLGRGDLTLTVSIEPKSLRITETPFGVIFDLEDAHLVGKPGTPGFPMKLLRLALPPYSDVTDIKVTVTKKTNVTKKPVFVAAIQEPRPGVPAKPGGKQAIKRSLFGPQRAGIEKPTYVSEARGVTLPRLQEYQRILADPAPVVRIAAIEHRGVATVLTLEVNPVHQNKDGIIELATEIKITLAYESTTTPKKGGLLAGSRDFRQARTKSEARRFTDILKGEVLNPDWITDIGDLIPMVFAQYDYLIITDNQQWDPVTMASTGSVGDLVSSFQKLVNWKKRRGLRARVVTITDIIQGTYGDFKTGARDLQEVLRNFLKWAYSHWDISWVLLGGDVSIVPVRIVAGASWLGEIYVETIDPPQNDRSFWTGTYLKMHVVYPGDWWPGDWPLILANPGTGALIPYDPAGTSTVANPGWYYTTDDTYATRTVGPTPFVRVNGPASLANATLRWLYRWNRIPTDLYYSSLVGPNYNVSGFHDWDLIDNELYGQHTDSADMDGVNYAADVGLGRAPVASVAEADAFINKVIAYEQFRRPDGTSLNLNWPRRLTMVSSNWSGRILISPTATTPPGNNQYHHGAADPYSLIKLESAITDIGLHLFAVVTDTDIRTLPYTPEAMNLGRGWYFVKSDTDLSVSELVITIFHLVFRIPVPTQWVVVYGYSDEVAPPHFIFDRAEADGSMADQEILRKQIAADFPGIDTVKRLYEDEIDLPAADATSPPVDHLTGNRLRDTLNFGQHFVSLSGHGSQGGCCFLANAMAQNATNGYHAFIAWADSCLTNDFQSEDAMSEDLLKNPNGGAVAYVGNTRFSWINWGDDYQREFFKRLKSVRHLALLNDSRFNLPNSDVYFKWCKFTLNLLGDPEMPLWVGKPNAMKVTHPAKIFKTDQHVFVKVTNSFGAAIVGAVVCFAIGDWVASAITDITGQADLHITPPATGSLEVVATAQDYIPYFGTILVEKSVICRTPIICKTNIICKASIMCTAPILCKASILCRSSILCGPKIVPCGEVIACNLAISGCKVGIGPGCPAIDPVPWKDLIDILKESGVKDVKELSAKQNTPRVRKVIDKLSPANRKALTLMLKRIGKE